MKFSVKKFLVVLGAIWACSAVAGGGDAKVLRVGVDANLGNSLPTRRPSTARLRKQKLA